MNRDLTSHRVTEADDRIVVHTIDEPGPGGAHHLYGIRLGDDHQANAVIRFQKGGVAEHGVNGITIETLLAICKDRLECFQAGPFASHDNQIALNGVDEALEALHKRTRDRIARGVEGQHKA